MPQENRDEMAAALSIIALNSCNNKPKEALAILLATAAMLGDTSGYSPAEIRNILDTEIEAAPELFTRIAREDLSYEEPF